MGRSAIAVPDRGGVGDKTQTSRSARRLGIIIFRLSALDFDLQKSVVRRGPSTPHDHRFATIMLRSGRLRAYSLGWGITIPTGYFNGSS